MVLSVFCFLQYPSENDYTQVRYVVRSALFLLCVCVCMILVLIKSQMLLDYNAYHVGFWCFSFSLIMGGHQMLSLLGNIQPTTSMWLMSTFTMHWIGEEHRIY